MKSKNYKYIILFITITILATIGLQVYWNIKNYRENKLRLINEVQIAFDNSIEYYYVEDSKDLFMAFVNNDTVTDDAFLDNLKLDTLFNKSKKAAKKTPAVIPPKKDSLKYAISFVVSESDNKQNKTGLSQQAKDSIMRGIFEDGKSEKSTLIIKGAAKIKPPKISKIKIVKGKKSTDSILKLKNLANKVVLSMVHDSIEFKKLKKALDKELTRKNIAVDYAFEHLKADTLFDRFPQKHKAILPLSTFSKSTYLPSDQKLKISFSDPTVLILQRSMTEILLSLLLSVSIIFCLLYLLKTINRQKKIDEIKNDLISNITHEFKTPITTVSTAIEGIRNFNVLNDTEKTNRYLDISSQQLMKLELMVEKLLETASLETDKLLLQKEPVNVAELLKYQIDKHQLLCPEKQFLFDDNFTNVEIYADIFHFENVISNLLDNAVKYGGTIISAEIKQMGNKIEIAIKDNGSPIEKSQRDRVFEKFYRIPKGNQHDVKGFGIGLYYSKKIIEKHGGSLQLISESNANIFKIALPYAN